MEAANRHVTVRHPDAKISKPETAMKLLSLLATLALFPATSRASAIRPDTAAGQRLVHELANKASDAFVTQTEQGETDDSSCESLKDDLLDNLSHLELKGGRTADNLLQAKLKLEKGSCAKNLFAVTVYLRAADAFN